ncbi:MarR family transcriptional regulator [Micromonospora sp. NPDC049559]|uniref:MarR family winged helix-turn-helix transcriptional regulator n=1 Tax=Micromonospora sp. NPDC049559 TaxID=3155923 RepID=UPI00341354A5
MTTDQGKQPGGSSDPLSLDDQMCFALYAASRAVTNAYRPILEDLGLTYPQYLVMLALWERGACAIKDLGVALQLDYGTLTPLLKRLEAAGHIRRERRSDDERSVHVTLTDSGRALRDRAEEIPPVMSRLMGLPADDFDTLRTLLRRLTASVSDGRAELVESRRPSGVRR